MGYELMADMARRDRHREQAEALLLKEVTDCALLTGATLYQAARLVALDMPRKHRGEALVALHDVVERYIARRRAGADFRVPVGERWIVKRKTGERVYVNFDDERQVREHVARANRMCRRLKSRHRYKVVRVRVFKVVKGVDPEPVKRQAPSAERDEEE